jgi:predicted RNA-binding protein (virulence factor B family)
MKDTDTLYEAEREFAKEDIKHLSEDEQELLLERRVEKLGAITNMWFEYGEYLTVEIDVDNKSIRVMSVEEFQKMRN